MANNFDDLDKLGDQLGIPESATNSLKKNNKEWATYILQQEKLAKQLKESQKQQVKVNKQLKQQQKELNRVNKKLQQFNKGNILSTKSTRNLQGSISVLRSELLISAFAFGMVSRTIGKASQDFADYENAQKRVRNVIKSTSGAAGLSAEEVIRLSGEYEALTDISETTITSGNALLLTFTNISKEIFPQTSMAVLDMAAAMNHGKVTLESVKSTSIMLGKALNNPIKGLNALARNGVKFSKEQKVMIKRLLLFNDLAGAQKIILEEVNKEFGDSANLDDYEQSIRALETALGNFSKDFGGAFRVFVEPVVNILTALLKLMKPSHIVVFTVAFTGLIFATRHYNKVIKYAILNNKGLLVSFNEMRAAQLGFTARMKAMGVSLVSTNTQLKIFNSTLGKIGVAGVLSMVVTLLGIGVSAFNNWGKKGDENVKKVDKSLDQLLKQRPDVLEGLTTDAAQKELEMYQKQILDLETQQGNANLKLDAFRKVNELIPNSLSSVSDETKDYLNNLLGLNNTTDDYFSIITYGSGEGKKKFDEFFGGGTENVAQFKQSLESQIKIWEKSGDATVDQIAKLKELAGVLGEGGKGSVSDWLGIIGRSEKELMKVRYSYSKLEDKNGKLEEKGIPRKQRLLDITKQTVLGTKEQSEAYKDLHNRLMEQDAIAKELIKAGLWDPKMGTPIEEELKAIEKNNPKLFAAIRTRMEEQAQLLMDSELPNLQRKNLEDWVDMTTEALDGLIEHYQDFYAAKQEIEHEAQSLELENQLAAVENMKASERVKEKERVKIAKDQQALKKKQHNEDITMKQKEIYVDLFMSIGKIITAYSRSVGGIFAKWSPFIGGPAIAKSEAAMTKGKLWGQIAFATAQAGAQAKVLDKQRMAYGGSFITSGPQSITVGDNAGGKERVDVTPINSPKVSGRKDSSNIKVSFEGNVLSEDFIVEEAIPLIKQAIRRGEDIGI